MKIIGFIECARNLELAARVGPDHRKGVGNVRGAKDARNPLSVFAVKQRILHRLAAMWPRQ
jgi:hypothetical protein